ncbi:MAG: peptide chain release factor N(5)-glutamine methyltransferase [Lachnospiraceae bacterium]|nr:peptide chain release factor N(5)-glutamine methyltransferase [Lachnospiraceae bacterium]
MSQNKLESLLMEASRKLKNDGVGEYQLDAQLFMMKATGFTKVQLFTKNDYCLNGNEAEEFWKMVDKRGKRIPTQYIIGSCQFMGLDFFVSNAVLIPRPDTEILVETILEYKKNNVINSIMDIGTGSGCIPISLLHYGVNKAVAVDISTDALEVARRNAERNKVLERIQFINSNLFEKLGEEHYGKFDAIVSNPPYIAKSVIKGLMPEVKDFEPMIALDGGRDGLDFYKEIIPKGKKYLSSNGWMFFEIGYDQGIDVSDLLKAEGFDKIEVIKDLAGLDRVVLGKIL